MPHRQGTKPYHSEALHKNYQEMKSNFSGLRLRSECHESSNCCTQPAHLKFIKHNRLNSSHLTNVFSKSSLIHQLSLQYRKGHTDILSDLIKITYFRKGNKTHLP